MVRANWSDNPWFPKELNQERLDCQRDEPDQYEHIWEGGYVTVMDGAYFSKHISKAKKEHRISSDAHKVKINEDPMMIVRLFVDIGGTGAKSDNFVIWAVQFIGQNINIINHYEVQGQPIGHHLNWLRSEGYTTDRCKLWLPHDGETNDRVIDVNYRQAFESAGYDVEVVPNQGKGAAKQRIESIRNNFHRMYFDEKCEAGLEAIGWYHEKRDEHRQVGLGPEHDWASHSADALGLCSICYNEPKPRRQQGTVRINIV